MNLKNPHRNASAPLPTLLLFCLIVGVISACTQGTLRTRSEPSVKSMSSEAYQIDFQPTGPSEGLFTGFMLSIRNLSEDAITVDWNKSRYMFNGQGQGGVVFQGVSEEELDNIPKDVISPGKSLSRELWPLRLVAIAPYRSPTVGHNERGFSPGAVPVGENGILIFMTLGEKLVREQVAVMITEDR